MMFFKQHRSAERDAFSVPHSVQKSIPIKRIYQDGVFQVSGKFFKNLALFDVNYAVASPEKQAGIVHDLLFIPQFPPHRSHGKDHAL